MRAVSPIIPEGDEPESVYAENHPVYQPLPCVRRDDGVILTRWLLSGDECRQIMEQGYLYLAVITDGGKIQPMKLTVDVPEEFQGYQVLNEEWPTEIGG